MAFLALGPGMAVLTVGPAGSSGRKGVSVLEESTDAAAAAPCREDVLDVYRREERAGCWVVSRARGRRLREERKRVAMFGD